MSYPGSVTRNGSPLHLHPIKDGTTSRPPVPRAYGEPSPPSGIPVPSRRPRVGHISFLNCVPLLWGLGRTGVLVDLELHVDSPDRLNEALAAGELDAGPISLVEFLKHADELVVLPEFAIGCDGPVTSCLIFSRLPLEQLDKMPVALGSTSRTSVRLAQLLLSEAIGVHPEYQVCPPDLNAMMRQAAAGVLIGDAAMYARYAAPQLDLQVYDLGQMWRDWTGLPFVFAVFAARRDYIERKPELVRQIRTGLLAAQEQMWSELDVICAHAARWTGFDEATLHHYYTAALNFDLGERQLAGITEFANRVGYPHAALPSWVTPPLPPRS